MAHEETRELEVVVYGATGFTGRLLAEYLVGRYGDDLKLGLAGRSLARLEALRTDLARSHPNAGAIPLLVADSEDPASLAELARRTRVVATTVGPYARYGSPVVAACVEAGTDYCDLAGEVAWMQRMIDAHHETARDHGARIVHVCGFDSIPSDLGTLMVQDFALREHGAPCHAVDFIALSVRGAWSGGTMATLGESLDEAARDPESRRAAGNPYALNPAGERSGPDGRAQQGVRRAPDGAGWTAPFPMASINEPVVRRSNALLGYRYGREFSYHESMRVGRGALGAIKGAVVTAGLAGFGGAMMFRPTRRLLERFVLPAPGEGPSRETIEKGGFAVRLLGRGRNPDGQAFTVRGLVTGDKDPGYGGTARMIGEAAVCLARDEVDGLPGGVLTPAAAMGLHLVERLREVGFGYSVESA